MTNPESANPMSDEEREAEKIFTERYCPPKYSCNGSWQYFLEGFLSCVSWRDKHPGPHVVALVRVCEDIYPKGLRGEWSAFEASQIYAALDQYRAAVERDK